MAIIKRNIMKTVFVFLITHFEETEALTTVDVLRRAGINVRTVSLTGESIVTSSHDVPVKADMLFEEVAFDTAEMLVIPGGTPAFSQHEGLKKEVSAFYNKGGKVAAICASPMVLGILGILKGRKATCFPGFEKYLEGATLCTDQKVVVDGNVTTGRGAGVTIDFALTLVEILKGKSQRDAVADKLTIGPSFKQ